MPAQTISVDQACDLVRSTGARLIAIDGLPCSGKSALAARLVCGFGFQTVPLDDFFMPLSDWPSPISPSFPFPFYRYGEFLAAVEALAKFGSCKYLPFDWDEMRISEGHRSAYLADGPVIVEGTSSLHPRIAPLYNMRLFLESHEPTILDAVLERDGNFFDKEWRNLWLPSVSIYMETNPRARADYLITGRGIVHE
jgi:hypothetical protein